MHNSTSAMMLKISITSQVKKVIIRMLFSKPLEIEIIIITRLSTMYFNKEKIVKQSAKTNILARLEINRLNDKNIMKNQQQGNTTKQGIKADKSKACPSTNIKITKKKENNCSNSWKIVAVPKIHDSVFSSKLFSIYQNTVFFSSISCFAYLR